MIRYWVDEDISFHVFPVSVEETWNAMLHAYDVLELEPEVVDRAGLRVGRSDLEVSRRLAGRRLSSMFSCGMTMTGPMADAARLTIAIQSTLRALPDLETEVSTRIEAVANPFDAAADVRRCSSTRVLENRIAEEMQEALGLPPG